MADFIDSGSGSCSRGLAAVPEGVITAIAIEYAGKLATVN